MKQANLGLNDEQLWQRQKDLQNQVQTVISRFRLREILGSVGQVRLVGSAEMGLMVWPDIDLEVLVDKTPDFDDALHVVKELHRSHVSRITIIDHRYSADPSVPKGIYLGPDVHMDDVKWQVDIWILNRQEADVRRTAARLFESKLNDENRKVILRLKQKVAASDKYHRGVSSVDLYMAVLDHEVSDLAGFKEYLAQTGRTL